MSKLYPIAGTPITLEAYQDFGIFYAEIWFGSKFWDAREFGTEAEQLAFIADPFKGERPKPRKVEIDTSYLDLNGSVWARTP